MSLTNLLLDSWDRQCNCIRSLATLIDEELAQVKPSEDGWSLSRQLCHIHNTRVYWLSMASGKEDDNLASLFHQEGEEWVASTDLTLIREELEKSARSIRDWLQSHLDHDGPAGAYDHPLFFLQHMVWHEGWHAGLIMLGLRLAGHDPPEEWEDPNLWGQWRNYG